MIVHPKHSADNIAVSHLDISYVPFTTQAGAPVRFGTCGEDPSSTRGSHQQTRSL